MRYRRLWIALAVVIAGSFAVLLYFRAESCRQAPPVPERVLTEAGDVVLTVVVAE